MDLAAGADASRGLGVSMRTGQFSISAMLTGQAPIRSVRVPTASGIDLVAGHPDVSLYVEGSSRAEKVMRDQLREVGSEHRYVVLDCSSQLGPVETAALAIANHVLVTYCPGHTAGLVPPALPRLQAAYITGLVGTVATKVLPDWKPDQSASQAAWGIPIWALGGIRYEARLPEMYWRGLPPILTQPETDFAQDIRSIAQRLSEC
jgi:MinD-like ATPase involved in chromosome partitioning or flagellar assembly